LLVWGWAEVAHPLVFYGLFLALGFPLASVLYEAAFAAVIGLLGRGRRTDLALLSLTIVAGLASTVFVPLTQWLVEAHGWRAALRILAVILGAITIPLHALVLAGVPGREAQAGGAPPAPAPPAPARATLYLCASAFLCATVAATALGIYLVPILLEQGFSPASAAGAVSLLGVGQTIGRPLFTWLQPRYTLGSWSVALFLPFAAAVGVLVLEPAGPLVLAAVLVLAMASGSLTLARTTWTLELFPIASFARVNAVIALWSLVGRAGAPLAMGAAHDLFGSHRPGLIVLALACLAGGGCAWLAARRRGG